MDTNISYNITALYCQQDYFGAEGIKLRNEMIFFRTSAREVSFDLAFEESKIQSIRFGVMMDTHVKISARNEQSEFDEEKLFEKTIRFKGQGHVRYKTFTCQKYFLIHVHDVYKLIRIQVNNVSEIHEFRINLIEINKATQDMSITETKNRNNFTYPKSLNEKPFDYVNGLKRQNDSPIPNKNPIYDPADPVTRYQQTPKSLTNYSLQLTIPQINQQDRLQELVRGNYLPKVQSPPKIKYPTNSYNNLLNGCVIVCQIQDEEIKM